MLKKDALQRNYGYLFTAIGGEVEDEDSEEGDAHARDDQVHLHITQNPPEAS